MRMICRIAAFSAAAAEEAENAVAQPIQRIATIVDQGVGDRHELRTHFKEDCLEEVLLATEVVVERPACADSGFDHDVFDTRTKVATFDEQPL